ncbi:hypothetical protein TNCV_1566791 [Trichonephila clavipes]|nr:hypothetical protein TNCV_1566791 [Trichonephila clavipes]
MVAVDLFIFELHPVRGLSKRLLEVSKVAGAMLKTRLCNILSVHVFIEMWSSYPQKEADLQLCDGKRYRALYSGVYGT